MIVCVLQDGTQRALDKAKVKLTWAQATDEGGEEEITFDLSDVQALLLIQPEVGWMPGNFGGMQVLGVRLTDPETQLQIETPMPPQYAADLGAALVEEAEKLGAVPSSSSITIARVLPPDPPVQ